MSLDNINVVIRARPQLGNSSKPTSWVIENNTIFLKDEDNVSTGIYSFDKIFDVQEKNVDIYNTAVSPMVRSALDGINLTVFAYGATCSGKTYTMNGIPRDPGVIPRIINEIFDQIQTYNDRNFLLRVSYVEIYSEIINDLLDKNNKDLKIREDVYNCVNYNPTEKIIKSSRECLSIMKMGTVNRTTGETQMNTFSSRSHSIFRIVIESTSNVDTDMPAIVSHVNLIDLAGSERVSQTGATGQRFKEGAHINKSLTALGLVIRQLVEKKDYINYRDSKLTRILSNSLGGNAKTIIICNINLESIEDTQSTLMFAQRAKTIKNKPKVNEISSEVSLAKKYANEFSQVKKLLEAELEKNKRLEVATENSTKTINTLHLRIQSLEENFVKKMKKPPKRRHTFCSTLSAISEDKEVGVISQNFNYADRFEEEKLPSFSNFDDDGESTDIAMTTVMNSSDHTPVKNLQVRLSAISDSYESLLEFSRLEKETDISTKAELESKVKELSEECASLRAHQEYATVKINKLLEEKKEEFNLFLNDHEFALESLKSKFRERERELLDKILDMEKSHVRNSLQDFTSLSKNFSIKENGSNSNEIESINERFELQQKIKKMESELSDVKNELFEAQDKLLDITEDLDKEEKKTKNLEEELRREVELRTEAEKKLAEEYNRSRVSSDSENDLKCACFNNEILQNLYKLKKILETNEKLNLCNSGIKDNTLVEGANSENLEASVKNESETSITSCHENFDKIDISIISDFSSNNARCMGENVETDKLEDKSEYVYNEILTNQIECGNNEHVESSCDNEEQKLKISALISEYVKEIEMLRSENDALTHLIATRENENEYFESENKRLIEKLQNLENEFQLKINELDTQTEDLKRTQETVNKVQHEKQSLEVKYETILKTQNNQTSELKRQVNELEKVIRQLENEKTMLYEAQNKAKCDIEFFEKQIRSMQERFNSEILKRDNAISVKISEEKNAVEFKYKSILETEKKRNKELIRALNDQVTDLQSKIREMEEEKFNFEILKRDDEMSMKISEEKSAVELKYKAVLETEQNRNKELIRTLNDQVTDLQLKIREMEQEKSNIESLKRDDEMSMKILEEINAVELKYKTILESEKNRNKELIRTLNDQVTNLQLKIREMEQEKSNIESLKRDDEMSIKILEEINAVELKYKTILESEENRNKELIRTLNDRIIDLQSKLRSTENEKVALQASIDETKCDIQKIKHQNVTLESTIYNLNKEMVNKGKMYEDRITRLKCEHNEEIEGFCNEIKSLKNENVETQTIDILMNPLNQQIIRLKELIKDESSRDFMQLMWKRTQNKNIPMRAKELEFLVDKVKVLLEERDYLKEQMKKKTEFEVLRASQFLTSAKHQIPDKTTESHSITKKNTGPCNDCKNVIEKWKTLATELQLQQNDNKTKLENLSFENGNLAEKLRQMEMKNRQLQKHIGDKENNPTILKFDGKISPGIGQSNNERPRSNTPEPEYSSLNKKGNKWKESRNKDHDSRRSIDLNTICSEVAVDSCDKCDKLEEQLQSLKSEVSLLKKRLESPDSSELVELRAKYDQLKKLCRIRNEENNKLHKQLSRLN